MEPSQRREGWGGGQMKALTVAIPTWKNHEQLHWCLNSLLRYVEYPLKVHVIDNGSSPEVKAAVEAAGLDWVVYDDPGENLGWEGAINRALAVCDTTYFCMLNDDVMFPPTSAKFFRTLIQHLQDPTVGAVGPTSNYVAGTQSLMHGLNYPLIHDTSMLIGLCLLTRTAELSELGGLDESLPGGDDLDLSLRYRQAGFKLRVDHTAYLHHFGSQTGSRVHPGHWDSESHQEAINNALIHKHSLLEWYNQRNNLFHECELSSAASYDYHKAWIESILQTEDGRTGLNLGCGRTRYPGMTNVDIRTAEDTGAGGERLHGADPDIIADVTELPEDLKADYILASHIFEHLVDPVAVLHDWMSRCQRLYLTLPSHGALDTMAQDYTHAHCYTEVSLHNLVEACGYAVAAIETTPHGHVHATVEHVQ